MTNGRNCVSSMWPWPGARGRRTQESAVAADKPVGKPSDKYFGGVTHLARILRCSRGQTRTEVFDGLAVFALSSHSHLRRMPPLSRKPPLHRRRRPHGAVPQYAL